MTNAGTPSGHPGKAETGLEGGSGGKLEAVDSLPVPQLQICAPALAGDPTADSKCLHVVDRSTYSMHMKAILDFSGSCSVQVLAANVVAVGWNTYLSWASHRAVPLVDV